MGYSCKPSEPDSTGLVALTIDKKEQEVKTYQQQLVEALQKFFAGKPNIVVFVEGLKPLPEDKYVHELFYIAMIKIPPKNKRSKDHYIKLMHDNI